MTFYRWLILFVLLVKDALTLRDVLLTIEPKIVRRLHQATLKCSYDLEKATLYYVKWYRGNYEFYRYTPSEHPYTKVFPLGGINVDVNSSNSTQVVLTEIDFQISGHFSCEVTTADTPVSTGTDSQSMVVVQLPEHPPTISVGRDPLDYGDILRANCTAQPARPKASLRFLLNDVAVAFSEPLSPREKLEVLWSDLALELVLNEHHFDKGRLLLRCVAQVLDVYHEEAELQLDSAREPVPEKVSAIDSATFVASSPLHILICTILFFS